MSEFSLWTYVALAGSEAGRDSDDGESQVVDDNSFIVDADQL